ncbi:hypothetical protein BKA03_002352 [Demequina lutea]|uniref:Uncharacterized protein n=1 Tax=Demequina lutea TaxID=431489 RepID=A0A7Y9ZDG8_9MICO|nr:hypothetical protein [Demequina lutea]
MLGRTDVSRYVRRVILLAPLIVGAPALWCAVIDAPATAVLA